MKRAKYVLLLLAAIILIATVIGIQITRNTNSMKQNKSNQDLNTKDSVNVHGDICGTIPSGWKIFADNKFSFGFQYPSTWIKQGNDAEIVNISGNVVSIGVFFSDTLSNCTLSVEYHLAPHGADLYKYAFSQYRSSDGRLAEGSNLIEVGGIKAIETNKLIRRDGKGKLLNPPLRLVLVDFLDIQQTGAVEIQFKVPIPDRNNEVVKFKKLLSTFKFINQ